MLAVEAELVGAVVLLGGGLGVALEMVGLDAELAVEVVVLRARSSAVACRPRRRGDLATELGTVVLSATSRTGCVPAGRSLDAVDAQFRVGVALHDGVFSL